MQRWGLMLISIKINMPLVVERFENQFFHQLAAAWNQSPAPWLLFPHFIRTIYSKRVVRATPTGVGGVLAGELLGW